MDDPRAPGASEWRQAQQQYRDAWLELTRRSLNGGEDEAGAAPAEALQRWWEAASQAASPTARALFGHLVDFSAPYFEMAQQLSRGTAQESAAAIEAWLAGMHAGQASADASARPRGAAAGAWQPPLDALAQLHARLRENAERLLAVPAFGYTREMQEQYQALARLTLAYSEALQEYNLGFARVAERAAANAGERLQAVDPDAPIDSLRALYDLWVDACEEEYAVYARSEVYAQRYARLVGALAALKRGISEAFDETLDALSLPTRREIDALQRRSQEARRAERGLRAQLEALERRVADPVPGAPRRAGVRRKPKTKTRAKTRSRIKTRTRTRTR